MASSGKKGKKNKGKVVPLHDFLANYANSSNPTAPQPRKATSWADEVENDEIFDSRPKPSLPSGPRASRDIDDSTVPRQPPYIAYISNLPYDTDEDDIRELFSELNIETLRLPRDDRDGEGGRLKGFGYVEFTERSGLVGAISIGDPTIKNRHVRIEVSANNDNDRRRGNRDRGDGNRDGNHDPERTTGNWRSGGGGGGGGGGGNQDQQTRGFQRDREHRDTGPPESQNRPGGWREGPPNNTTGFRDDKGSFREERDRGGFREDRGGFNRDDRERSFRDNRDRGGFREDRDRGGFRDDHSRGGFNRDGDRGFNRDERDNRDRGGFQEDRDRDHNRPLGGAFTPRRNFEDRGFNREDRDRDSARRDESTDKEPRTRPKLQLVPRTKPLDNPLPKPEEIIEKEKETETIVASISPVVSVNIFGSAKPVDTAARERQIEERLEKEKDLKTDIKAGGDTRDRDEERRPGSRGPRRQDDRNRPPPRETRPRTENTRAARPEKTISREIKDTRTDEDRMPKMKEQTAPNFAASNKFAFLVDDDNSYE